jgi:hypothetical protein
MDSIIFSDENTFHVSGAGSGEKKIHMPPWNIFVTDKR